MPLNITPETSRITRTIAEISVSVPAPYAEGHPLTDGEAKQMNQVLAENISNNLRKKLADGKVVGDGEDAHSEPYSPDEAQKLVDEYMLTYEPGVRGSGSGEARVTDPTEREARKIAKMKAIELVKEHGMKAKDVDLSAITDQIFEANKEFLMKEGAKIVKAQDLAKKASDGLNLQVNLVPAAPAANGGTEVEEPAAA